MKKKYQDFIELLTKNTVVETKKWFNALSPVEAGTIIFMSQPSAVPEHHQLVADFILKQHGDSPARGVIRMWS